MPRYKIADVVFDAEHLYKYTAALCKNYLYHGEQSPEFVANVEQKDIDDEKAREGAAGFPDYYLESLALFRKLCDYVLERRDGIIFHSSAVAVDGKAYLFTAPSGTGKSTHARLWRQVFGDKVVYINDDKPIIRCIDGEFYVYGTPWNGKHHLDTNARAKLEAICEIRRGKVNRIRELSSKEMLMVVLNQTIRPTDERKFDKLVGVLDKLLTTARLYRLECNISEEAARTSYNAMVERAEDKEKGEKL